MIQIHPVFTLVFFKPHLNSTWEHRSGPKKEFHLNQPLSFRGPGPLLVSGGELGYYPPGNEHILPWEKEN